MHYYEMLNCRKNCKSHKPKTNFSQDCTYLINRAREISIPEEVTIPLVQLSTKCRIGCWCIGKYFFNLVNNQVNSLLTTAHAVPSLSPCIEISMIDGVNYQTKLISLSAFASLLINNADAK